MLIYVRHGAVMGGASESNARLRRPTDQLIPEGRKQAKAVGQYLRGLKPTTFTMSGLPRAVESGGIIGQQMGLTPQVDHSFNTWDTGQLSGQKFSDVKDYLMHYISHPDQPIPGGESLNDFLSRFVPAVKQRVNDSGIHLVVGHGRGVTALSGLASPVGGKGGEIDPKYLKQKSAIGPGELLGLPPSWNMTTIKDHLKG